MGLFKKIGKTLFNVPAWMDTKRIGMGANYIKDTTQTLLQTEQPGRKETFEQAMKRLKLSEADIVLVQQNYFKYFLLFLVITLILLSYAFYLFYGGFLRATLVTLLLCILSSVYTFRYHFWYYKIKSRKLGITIKEWFKHGILGFKS